MAIQETDEKTLKESIRAKVDEAYNLKDTDPGRGIEIIRQVLTENPGYDYALARLGWLLVNDNQDEAIDAFNKVISYGKIDSYSYSMAMFGKGFVYLLKEDYIESFRILNINKDLKKVVPESWWSLGYVAIKLGDYKGALESFQHYIEKGRTDSKNMVFMSRAYNYHGYAAVSLNNFDLAEKSFEKALEIDQWSFGAEIGKTLVSSKRNYYLQQKELINTANDNLKQLFKDFSFGINAVQWMYIAQFFIGILFIISALVLAVMGNNELIAMVAGATGGIITILSLVKSAPVDLQKNRIDFSQWMIAYYNWINAMYSANAAITRETKDNQEMEWNKISPIQDYMTKLTNDTIITMDNYCSMKETKPEEQPTN